MISKIFLYILKMIDKWYKQIIAFLISVITFQFVRNKINKYKWNKENKKYNQDINNLKQVARKHDAEIKQLSKGDLNE